jgi:hypothetical protein
MQHNINKLSEIFHAHHSYQVAFVNIVLLPSCVFIVEN